MIISKSDKERVCENFEKLVRLLYRIQYCEAKKKWKSSGWKTVYDSSRWS